VLAAAAAVGPETAVDPLASFRETQVELPEQQDAERGDAEGLAGSEGDPGGGEPAVAVEERAGVDRRDGGQEDAVVDVAESPVLQRIGG